MLKETVSTSDAPAAIGPYSQAVKCGGYVFASGQIPIDPATGQLVNGGIKDQTSQVLRNLDAVLKAAGSSLEKVVKTTIFIKDMNQFSVVNDVYSLFFADNPPARSTVEVSRLPKDAEIEIEVIASL